MSAMASAPQDDDHQTAFSEAFKKLKTGFNTIDDALSPGDWDRLDEIELSFYFSKDLIGQIERFVEDNPMTPAVVREELQNISQNREQELSKAFSLLKNLNHFHFEGVRNKIQEGQVGYKIPRDLFNNNISGFIKELQFLKKFTRIVSESSGCDAEEIRVGSISTTDPLIWLIIACPAAKEIGKLIHWALDTWKKVADINQVRAQTAKIQSFSEDEIDGIFGSKIRAEIDLAIEEKCKALSAQIEEMGRRNEIENGLRSLLPGFLARIERGMTIDIRYLPPPEIEKTGDTDQDTAAENEVQAHEQEFRDIAASLRYERPEGDPVLQGCSTLIT